MLKHRIQNKHLTSSSKKWLQRQLNDKYVICARNEGYRSRAAFKIIEIQRKYSIIKENSIVLDLGSTPGGWSQIVAPLCKHVIAVDLLEMQPLPNVDFIRGDFQSDEILNKIRKLLNGRSIDVIISDMAPSTCGIPKIDHLRIVNLLEQVFTFSKQILSIGGALVAKTFQGGGSNMLLKQLKASFRKVSNFKPNASRKESAEMYVICQEFWKSINKVQT